MQITARFIALTTGALLVGCAPNKPTPLAATKVVHETDAGPATGDVPTDSKGLLATIDAMREQLKDRPRDFNVDVALANLFYNNARYIDAVEFYTNALDRLSGVESRVDPSRAGGPVDADCRLESDKGQPAKGGTAHTVEHLLARAEVLARKDAKASASCLAQLAPQLSFLHSRRGTSWYLIGNIDKSRPDHAAALRYDPDNVDALFFSGAAELDSARGDIAKFAAGKAFWEHLLKVAPDHPRAEMVSQLLPKVEASFARRNAAVRALPTGMIEGLQSPSRTPEEEARLDKIVAEAEALLGKQQWQQALELYSQVMPQRPDGRTALGMGIALRELGRPTAEGVLLNATRLPGVDAVRAKYELGLLYESESPSQAKELFGEVAGDPKFGPLAKARLVQLH